jgi:hypothetical protein
MRVLTNMARAFLQSQGGSAFFPQGRKDELGVTSSVGILFMNRTTAAARLQIQSALELISPRLCLNARDDRYLDSSNLASTTNH